MKDDGLTKNERLALAELEFELFVPHTQEEVAERLGLTRQSIIRIEHRALAKLAARVPKGWR